MTPASNEFYLGEAQNFLADLIAYLVGDIGLSLEDAWALFLKSRFAQLMEKGDVRVIAGMSGFEAAQWILNEELGRRPPYPTPSYGEDPGTACWTGWALTYFQRTTGIRFADLTGRIPISTIARMCCPYHEMPISTFAEDLLSRFRNAG